MNLKSFLKYQYNGKDIPLDDLKPAFLQNFEYYLKTELDHKQVTVNKVIQRFRKPIKLAVGEGLVESDPFSLHKPGKVIKKVVFLTKDELDRVENHSFISKRLERVQDLFIFCCYTGLAFHEMSRLKPEHIIKGFDESLWIQMKREKTGKSIAIPLLPKAIQLIEKYRDGSPLVFPSLSNQKFNSYLKEIALKLEINKNISHHTARKTFASTVLLYNDVPIEIVSELLGHSSIKITQDYYGKIVNKAVSTAMNNLSIKLANRDE